MKLRLIDDWRRCWRWASVQLAALASILSGIGVANWPVLQWLVESYLPQGRARMLAAALVALIVFVIPTAARIFTKDAGTDG